MNNKERKYFDLKALNLLKLRKVFKQPCITINKIQTANCNFSGFSYPITTVEAIILFRQHDWSDNANHQIIDFDLIFDSQYVFRVSFEASQFLFCLYHPCLLISLWRKTVDLF